MNHDREGEKERCAAAYVDQLYAAGWIDENAYEELAVDTQASVYDESWFVRGARYVEDKAVAARNTLKTWYRPLLLGAGTAAAWSLRWLDVYDFAYELDFAVHALSAAAMAESYEIMSEGSEAWDKYAKWVTLMHLGLGWEFAETFFLDGFKGDFAEDMIANASGIWASGRLQDRDRLKELEEEL